MSTPAEILDRPLSLSELSDDQLEAELVRRHSRKGLRALVMLERRTHAAILSEISRLSCERVWARDGSYDMRSWLRAEFGWTKRTAAGTTKAANKLVHLPAISAAYENGALNFDQIYQLIRYATRETDEALAKEAPSKTVGQLKYAGDRAQELKAEDVQQEHATRWVQLTWNEDHTVMDIQGQLPREPGEIVEKAIRELAQTTDLPEDDGSPRWEARQADALVDLCSGASGGRSRRPTIVIHTEASVLEGGDGLAESESGMQLDPEAVRRMACWGRWRWVFHAGGAIVAVTETKATVPKWLEDEVIRRDRGMCVFGGCERDVFLQVHHLRFRSNGGRHELSNLALLCGSHHRLIHEGGWRTRGDANTGLTWIRSDGTPLRR